MAKLVSVRHIESDINFTCSPKHEESKGVEAGDHFEVWRENEWKDNDPNTWDLVGGNDIIVFSDRLDVHEGWAEGTGRGSLA